MPDFEAEIIHDLEQARHIVASGIEHLVPHHAQSQAPAPQPVNLQTATPEGETMSLSTDLKAFADRLDTLGEEAVTKLEAVAANPATAEVFSTLHVLTGLNLDPAIITGVASGLKTLVQIYQPEPVAAAPAA